MLRFVLVGSLVAAVAAQGPDQLPVVNINLETNSFLKQGPDQLPVVNINLETNSFLKTPLMASVVNDLAQKFPEENVDFLTQQVANAVQQYSADNAFPNGEFECARDYSSCPETYVSLGGDICAPGLGSQYTKKLNFRGLSPMEKQNYAATSGAQFPCLDSSSFLKVPNVVNLHVKEHGFLKVPNVVNLHVKEHGYFLKNIAGDIRQGGQSAFRALTELNAQLDQPNSQLTPAFPSIMQACRQLMMKESTPDQVRFAAGSILTKLTNIPVISEISDPSSGGSGKVNIVLPSPSRVYGQ